jgi:hypothetical protein
MLNIKSVITIVVSMGFLLITSSCGEEFLEQKSYGEITKQNFYKNKSHAVAGITAAYASLGSWSGSYCKEHYFLSSVTGDGVVTPNGLSHRRGKIDAWLIKPGNSIIYDTYNNHYPTIFYANTVLDNIDPVKMDDNYKKEIKGEAKFLRSLMYFNMVRLFQHVPLIKSSEIDLGDVNKAKTKADKIYEFIISDLKEAIGFLPQEPRECGRASKNAARGILAKVYLTRPKQGFSPDAQADYQKAYEQLDAITKSGVNDLNPSVKNLFGIRSWSDYECDNEIMFSIQAKAEGGQISPLTMHAQTDDYPVPSAWDNFIGEAPFYMKYDDQDVRKTAYYSSEFVKGEDTLRFNINDMANDDFVEHDGPAIEKYTDVLTNVWSNGRDAFILRYADILLMKAEAIIERDGAPNAEAVEMVNMVRRRAHGVPPEQTSQWDLSIGMGYEEFKDSLYLERRKELLFEGHAFYDGLRFWDRFKEAVEYSSRYEFPGQDNLVDAIPKAEVNIQDKNKVFPIPTRALEQNPKLTQHELWE